MSVARLIRDGPRRPPAVFEAGSSLDPFQILAAEHALIRLHLSRLVDASSRDGAGAEAQKALAALSDGFRLHERREDLVLYPVCERLFGGRDGVASVLREDHGAIGRTLERLLAEPPRLGAMSASTLDELRSLLEDHFVKEERVLFPLMTAYLPGKESASLARRLRAAAVG